MYELGERCFNELINRSLIQPWDINRHGEVTVCRVHDTILDFIVYKSVEENFVTLLGVPELAIRTHNKVRRLSLQHKSNGDVGLQPNLIYTHVRSLAVFGRSMPIPFLLKSRFLQVLDLEGCHMLAGYLNNISSSFQLKYLSLRNTPITELPEQIGELRNLETLNLEGTFITQVHGLLHLCLCIGAERGGRSYNVHLKVSSSHGFTCLRNLRIGGKNCGLGLMLETGSLPKLEKLVLEFDAIETDSVTNLHLAFGIEHLPCLTSHQYPL